MKEVGEIRINGEKKEIIGKREKMENWEELGKELDLIGKQCPMTFVYTKVALEEMQSGEILRVLLDFSSAFTSVPENVSKQQLGSVVHKVEEDGRMTLWIQKA
ncbi:MAG: sulfurtransferase TusA family protein [Promethearchaeota archaeon]